MNGHISLSRYRFTSLASIACLNTLQPTRVLKAIGGLEVR